MGRVDVLSLLYAKSRTPEEFNYETLTTKPLLSYLTVQDIEALHKIATSVKLSSKPKIKYKMIDEILVPRGFKKLASGTNRVVYKYLNDQNIVLKVAYDEVALKDNPAEYRNQFLLKPFCAKVFEVSPCGTVALQERVQPIVTRAEYMQIASDVFDLLINKILGKYVLDDIGTKYYQNIGLRLNYGPVILDYPYVFELDGEKLHCTEKEFDGSLCDGEIDYDAGFNKLVCSKCGKQYFAWQLEKSKDESGIVTAKGEIEDMSISIMRGNEVINTIEEMGSSDSIKKPSFSVSVTSEKRRRGRGKIKDDFAPMITIEDISVSTPVKDLVDNALAPKQPAVEEKKEQKPVSNAEIPISKVKEEKLNENISATSLGNDINKNIFGVQEEKEVEDVFASSNECTTSIGSLINDALEQAGLEKNATSEEDVTKEKDSKSVEEDQEFVEPSESESLEESSDNEDNSDLAVIVDTSDRFDQKTQTILASEIKPIKLEEIQGVLDKVNAEYEEYNAENDSDISDAY